MPYEPATLAATHWQALKGERRAEAEEILATLRSQAGEEAAAANRTALAHALTRAHWDAGRWGEHERARALLDELRALCRQAKAVEAQRFELAKSLGTAHWDAVRYGDTVRAGRLLGELRDLARRGDATEGQRLVLAEAFANEIRHQGGPRGDVERIAALLKDLRHLVGRPHAPEEQRNALARALLDLHHEMGRREGGDRSRGEHLEELRSLAARAGAAPAQRLALVEALQDVPWQAGLFGHRRRQEALLAAVVAAEPASEAGARPRAHLCDALVRMHAKVRRAEDDEFADRLLDRLRVLAVRPEATVEQWHALATALCDGLWIAGSFGNRDLAEELVEVFTLLTGDVDAEARQRIALAGLLVGAHHRAVRHEDALLSKELLTLLFAWAVRPEAAAAEREVLAHGLALADEHARRRGDKALARKIEEALAAIVPPENGRKAAALADLASKS